MSKDIKTELNELTVNGIRYIKENLAQTGATPVDTEGREFVVIRADKAGVFAGFLESLDEATGVAVLLKCRRIWYWDGAASLTQLAIDGVSKPENCKFTKAIDKIKILGVIEVLPTTPKAKNSIDGVPEWVA